MTDHPNITCSIQGTRSIPRRLSHRRLKQGLPQALLLLSGVLRGKPAAGLQPRGRAVMPAAICLRGLLPCLLASHLLQRHVRLHQRGDTRLLTPLPQSQRPTVSSRSQRVKLRGLTSREGT